MMAEFIPIQTGLWNIGFSNPAGPLTWRNEGTSKGGSTNIAEGRVRTP